MEKKTKRIEDRVWDFFCSLKLGIVTLILLSVTSIIGTVLKQGQSMNGYVAERLGRMFKEGFPQGMTEAAFRQTAEGQSLVEGFQSTYRFYDAMWFFDMYHSWWFLALLGLFAMNLICCSINRLPRVLKIVREPELKPQEKFYTSLANRDEKVVSGSLETVESKVTELLGKEFSSPKRTEDDGKVHLFAQKSAYARFGVYVTHLSILVILLGAMIGVKFGYKGYVWIEEGETVNAITLRDGGRQLPIDFSVKCEQFVVDYYPDTGMPKEFRSDLVVFINGQEVQRKSIEVNDPLFQGGLTFYQQSYGAGGGPFTLRVTPRLGGAPFEVQVNGREEISLPDGSSFALDQFVRDYNGSNIPAIYMHVNSASGKRLSQFPVLYNFEAFKQQQRGGYEFDLIDMHFATMLEVAKDPGVEVVWAGCILMIVGTMIAFFVSHRRIWVTLTAEDGKVKVVYGGNAHRNQPGFALWFDDFKAKFQETVS